MPQPKPARPIRGTDIDSLVDFANSVEFETAQARTDATTAINNAAEARTDADTALAQVQSRYVKPVGGIPPTDLSAAVLLANTPGTPNNPITDAAAARPAGLTVVWWDTYPTFPTNAQSQDMVDDRFAAATGTPAQITGLASSSVGSTSFALSWTSEVNSTSYRVERRVQGSTTWTASTTTGTSFTFTGLTSSTTYETRVTGINSAGTAGTPSTVLTVSTTAGTAKTTLYAQSFETDTGTWSPTGATLARVSERAAVGTYSLRLTASAAPYSAVAPRITAAAGKEYTVTARVSNGAASDRLMLVQLLFFNASNGFVGDLTYQANVSSGTGFVTITGTGVAPAGATQVAVQFKVDFSSVVGDVVYVDDVTIAG